MRGFQRWAAAISLAVCLPSSHSFIIIIFAMAGAIFPRSFFFLLFREHRRLNWSSLEPSVAVLNIGVDLGDNNGLPHTSDIEVPFSRERLMVCMMQPFLHFSRSHHVNFTKVKHTFLVQSICRILPDSWEQHEFVGALPCKAIVKLSLTPHCSSFCFCQMA